MDIKKSNGKVKFILDDEYLIAKGLFKDKKIKRDNIRSALIYGNSLMILTYENKIFRVRCMESSLKYLQGLKYIVDEVNKEDIVFGDFYQYDSRVLVIISIIYIMICVFDKFNPELQSTAGLLLIPFILIINAFFTISAYVYNTKTKQVFRLKFNGKEAQIIEEKDIEIKRDNGVSRVYKSKNNYRRFHILINDAYLIYPANCVSELNEFNKRLHNFTSN